MTKDEAQHTKRIVFCLDFSDMTEAVIAAALRASEGEGSAELHAVCVLDPSGNPLAPVGNTDEVQKLEEALQVRVAGASDASGRAIACHACVGSVANEISDLATSLKADLIVIGRHGHSGAQPFVLGSTPVRLLQLAHCSVLIVQPANYR